MLNWVVSKKTRPTPPPERDKHYNKIVLRYSFCKSVAAYKMSVNILLAFAKHNLIQVPYSEPLMRRIQALKGEIFDLFIFTLIGD